MFKYALEAMALLLTTLAGIVKDYAGSKWPRAKTVVYLLFLLCGCACGVLVFVVGHNDQAAEGAKKAAATARIAFHSGLEQKNAAVIAGNVAVLEQALKDTKTNDDLFYPQLQVLHDLALSHERLAYGDNATGCAYRVTSPGVISACRLREPSYIYVTPPAFRGGEIRCTDVNSKDQWSLAKARYDEIEALLKSNKKPDPTPTDADAIEVARAGRSAAYFFLCDQLRFDAQHIEQIRPLLRAVQTAADKVPERRKDATSKQFFVEALEEAHATKFACDEPCVTGGSERRFIEVRGAEFERAANPSEIAIQPGFVTLAQGAQTGEIVVKQYDVTKFDQLILSWNAETPPGSWIEFSLKARIDANWSREYRMGSWSLSEAAHRHSPRSEADSVAEVNVDTLKILRGAAADALEVKIVLHAALGGVGPKLRSIGISLSWEKEKQTDVAGNRGARGTTLPVRPMSQRSPEGSDKWCSPTSLAMVLRYWADETGRFPATEVDLKKVAEDVEDKEGAEPYGNWPFNTAAIARYGNGFLHGVVTRLVGVEQLEHLIARGFPVITSIKWGQSNTLQNAPLKSSEGHLVVVVGFDAAGNVIVNDPAASTEQEVRRSYARVEFEDAWSPKRRTAYLIFPESRPPPNELSASAGRW